MITRKFEIKSLTNKELIEASKTKETVVIRNVPAKIPTSYIVGGIISFAGILFLAAKLKKETNNVFDMLKNVEQLKKQNRLAAV